MTKEECISIVREFLALFDGHSIKDDEQVLERVLDRLAVAQVLVETDFDGSDWPDPPNIDYPTRREMAARRFPRLGHYNIADEVCGEPGKSKVNVGDALDDLADIFGDLADVVWLWEHASKEAAIWDFKSSYRLHWGGHLRGLQLFLYEHLYVAYGAA
jgi:hypothetical protein